MTGIEERPRTVAASDSTAALAFNRLMGTHRLAILGFVHTLIPHPADAEEMSQRVVGRLWEEFGKYRSNSRFLPWACAVAYSQILGSKRHRNSDPIDRDSLAALAAAAGEIAEMAEARRSALIEFGKELSPAQRATLTAVYGTHDTAVEMAFRTRLPESRIRAEAREIRVALKNKMNLRFGRIDSITARNAALIAIDPAAGTWASGRLPADPVSLHAYAETAFDSSVLRLDPFFEVAEKIAPTPPAAPRKGIEHTRSWRIGIVVMAALAAFFIGGIVRMLVDQP